MRRPGERSTTSRPSAATIANTRRRRGSRRCRRAPRARVDRQHRERRARRSAAASSQAAMRVPMCGCSRTPAPRATDARLRLRRQRVDGHPAARRAAPRQQQAAERPARPGTRSRTSATARTGSAGRPRSRPRWRRTSAAGRACGGRRAPSAATGTDIAMNAAGKNASPTCSIACAASGDTLSSASMVAMAADAVGAIAATSSTAEASPPPKAVVARRPDPALGLVQGSAQAAEEPVEGHQAQRDEPCPEQDRVAVRLDVGERLGRRRVVGRAVAGRDDRRDQRSRGPRRGCRSTVRSARAVRSSGACRSLRSCG